MDLGKNPLGICNFFPAYFKNLRIKSKIKILDIEQQKATKCVFNKKVAFFQKNQLGIGQSWRKLAEIGQKLDFRVFYSEI